MSCPFVVRGGLTVVAIPTLIAFNQILSDLVVIDSLGYSQTILVKFSTGTLMNVAYLCDEAGLDVQCQ